MKIERGDVWFAAFPLEEDPDNTINRPVVVLDEDKLMVLCTKITKRLPRSNDDYDTPIIYWEEAKLRLNQLLEYQKLYIWTSLCLYIKSEPYIQMTLNKLEIILLSTYKMNCKEPNTGSLFFKKTGGRFTCLLFKQGDSKLCLQMWNQ